MTKYASVPLNKTELEHILKWYDAYQNETQPTLVDAGLAESLKQHLKDVE